MATLTTTAFYTRFSIKWGTLLLIFLISGRIFWAIGSAVYTRIFPPPPPPPTVLFGKLPALPFPENPGLPKFTFTMQTKTGELPTDIPTTTLVYLMPEKKSAFLGLDEATAIARNLGFTAAPTPISDTIYRYNREYGGGIFDINIVNKTFSISYNLEKTPELLTQKPKSNDDANNAVRSLLNQSLMPEDLVKGEKTYQYFKAVPPDLNETISLSEANFVRVNLFREKYNELPVMTPDRRKSNVWFLISGDVSRDRQIIAGEFHYFPVDKNSTSTYPIKSPQQAWDELNAGKGYVAQTPANNITTIVIRRIYLAYYDSGRPQGFLQPIYVFEGDNGFVSYIPAISPELYNEVPVVPSPAPAESSPAPEAENTETTQEIEEATQ